ncbi:MAG TPA: TIGR03086 family metal-binding protein [Mycobacteriales bacterium]|nr:TIGR03086 family metal-binding protein [Mycobacteriales bacterium]
MSEVSERYERTVAGFATRLKNVPADLWSAPTPCTEWTVRDLVAHVIGTHWRIDALRTGSEPVAVDPTGDLWAQWQSATDTIREAVGDEAWAAATVVHRVMGEMPFESVVSGLLCTDLLGHTWDLARATGQDERLDPDAVAASMAFAVTADEPMRRSGAFAAKIEPAPGADAQTRYLNFCGRRV